LAVFLKHSAVAKFLLEQGADPREKSKAGWSALDTCLASGLRENVKMLYIAIQQKLRKVYREKSPKLLQELKNLPDFHLELKWEFKSWVPFVSRFCPSDTYHIWKRGCSLRVDTTLVGYENMKWKRGKLTLMLIGDEKIGDGTLYLVNHQSKQYERVMEALEEIDKDISPEELETEIDELMLQELLHSKLDADTVAFRLCTNWRGAEKITKVGDYNCKIYNLEGFCYRVQHRKFKGQAPLISAPSEASSNGSNNATNPTNTDNAAPKLRDHSAGDDLSHWSWQSYIQDDTAGEPKALMYRNEVVEVKNKLFKGTTYISGEFPRSVRELLPIFECLAPTQRIFDKLASFIKLKLPDQGFPVKLEIPVFPTVTGQVTFLNYSELKVDPSLFVLPADYLDFKRNNNSKVTTKLQ